MTKLYAAAIFPLLLIGVTSCRRGDAPSEAMPKDREYISVPVAPVSRYQGNTASLNADTDSEDKITSLQLMQVIVPNGKKRFYKDNFIPSISTDQNQPPVIYVNTDYLDYDAGTGWAFMVANLPGLKDELVSKENSHNAGNFYGIEIDALQALAPPFPMSMTCQTIKFSMSGEEPQILISPDPGSAEYSIPGVNYSSPTNYFQMARVVAAIHLKVAYNTANQELSDFKAEILNVPKKIRLFARQQYGSDGYYSNTPQGLTSELNKPANKRIKDNLIKSPKDEMNGGVAQNTVDFGHIYVPESYPQSSAQHMKVRLSFNVTLPDHSKVEKYIDIDDLPLNIKRNTLYEINVRLVKVYENPEIQVHVKDWVTYENINIPPFT